MSAAQQSTAIIHGNTARVLSPAEPSSAQPSKRRTPLALVTSTPRRRRAPFVVFCFLALVGALVTVLVLNISVSSGQYELVQLHAAQAELLKSNQELTQQVQNKEAPQNLVNEASELGMVTSTSVGQINLKNMSVAGTPKPAPAGDKTKSLIAAPSLPNDKPSTGADAPAVPGGPAKAGAPTAAGSADLHGGTIPAPEQKNG